MLLDSENLYNRLSEATFFETLLYRILSLAFFDNTVRSMGSRFTSIWISYVHGYKALFC